MTESHHFNTHLDELTSELTSSTSARRAASTYRRGFDLFERMHHVQELANSERNGRPLLRGTPLEVELAKWEEAPSEVRKAASLYESVFGTPQNARENAGLVAAQAGLVGSMGLGSVVARDIERLEEQRGMNRRDLLRSALGKGAKYIGLGTAGAFIGGNTVLFLSGCSGGGGGVTQPTMPNPIAFTDSITELIKGGSISSGNIKIKQSGREANIEIQNGSYSVATSDGVTEGRAVIQITSDEGYARRTSGQVSTSGILVDLQDGRMRPLDIIGNDNVTGYRYNLFRNRARREGITKRWIQEPRVAIFDQTLYSWEGLGAPLEVVGEFNPPSRTIANIRATVNNDYDAFSGGFAKSTEIVTESSGASMPDPGGKRNGWIRYVFVEFSEDNQNFLIARDDYSTSDGVVEGAFMFLNHDRLLAEGQDIRAPIVQDTYESFGYQPNNKNGITISTENGAKPIVGDFIGPIAYGRKPGQRDGQEDGVSFKDFED